jgi:hypothetical protein
VINPVLHFIVIVFIDSWVAVDDSHHIPVASTVLLLHYVEHGTEHLAFIRGFLDQSGSHTTVRKYFVKSVLNDTH